MWKPTALLLPVCAAQRAHERARGRGERASDTLCVGGERVVTDAATTGLAIANLRLGVEEGFGRRREGRKEDKRNRRRRRRRRCRVMNVTSYMGAGLKRRRRRRGRRRRRHRRGRPVFDNVATVWSNRSFGGYGVLAETIERVPLGTLVLPSALERPRLSLPCGSQTGAMGWGDRCDRGGAGEQCRLMVMAFA
jgi:hypothetical protein